MNPVLQDNIRCIEQALELLDQLPPALYARADDIAPIGAHIRHNIDHYTSFLAGAAAGEIDYDAREREAAMETDPGVARRYLSAAVAALADFAKADLDRPVRVKMDSGSAGEWSGSTLRRELQFLLSHSVHHYAIIAIACRAHGVDLPADFGVAPSTVKYREALAGAPPACVR